MGRTYLPYLLYREMHIMAILLICGTQCVKIEMSYEVLRQSSSTPGGEVLLPCVFNSSTPAGMLGKPTTDWNLLNTGTVIASVNSSGILNSGSQYAGRVRLLNNDAFDSSIYFRDVPAAASFSCVVTLLADVPTLDTKHIVVITEENEVLSAVSIPYFGLVFAICGLVVLAIGFFVIVKCAMPDSIHRLSKNFCKQYNGKWWIVLLVIVILGVISYVVGLILQSVYLDQEAASAKPDSVYNAGVGLSVIGFGFSALAVLVILCIGLHLNAKLGPPRQPSSDGKVRRRTKDMAKRIQELMDSGKAYPSTPQLRGRVLIINNHTFHGINGLKDLEGFQADIESLKSVFLQLDFASDNISTGINLKAQEITECLKSKVETCIDCFICVLSSHGGADYVFGSDGAELGIDKITELFDEANCPSMIGMPKLFFIDTCQGVDWMTGRKGRRPKIGVPIKADIFLASTTVSGFSACAGQQGSYFIQSLVSVLREFAHDADLQELLTKVNADISEKTRIDDAGDFKQMSWVSHSLRKMFYFSPAVAPVHSQFQSIEIIPPIPEHDIGSPTIHRSSDESTR